MEGKLFAAMLAGLLLVVLFNLSTSGVVQGQQKDTPKTKLTWEYKGFRGVGSGDGIDATVKSLNAEGKEGWECVGVVYSDKIGNVCLLLKRPR